MMTSTEIRQLFMDFFSTRGHKIVPSAPIVIKNDPTLMFTNAGMNQFKDYFLGNQKAPYRRVADTQKCLRVSGKHNDLEEVGVDTYHHTMFEMLGNWSFGDYFKKEAIAWSWELLTKTYQIPGDRLYATIFEGDAGEQLPRDDEAFNEWKKWLPEDRILMGKKKDNFWEMGDTGPCGPCSEIHIDCRPDEERMKTNGRDLVNKDDPQVIELWNNVFIQFNRLKNGSLEPLPEKHVDTGMGLERLVMVLQGKTSSYDTDIFTGTIGTTERITEKKYEYTDVRKDVAFRVVADHIRAIAFTIADGQLPSNTGAGYVIRRILRRAVRYYFSYLDFQQPLLYQLVPGLNDQFGDVFPEIKKQAEFISKVIREEEEAFLRTLEKGIASFNERVKINAETGSPSKKIFDGVSAFILYDTYGFPIDLTQLMAKEIGWEVNMTTFYEELEKQKQRSRAATTIDTEDWVVLDDYARNEFVGYDEIESRTKVVKYRKVKAKNRNFYQVVLEVTPFYAESGGQVGDRGELIIGNEKFPVTDTKKENDLIIHFMDTIPADMSGEVFARVDAGKRRNTEIHHSATHLVHAALRTVLGKHVTQKGSLVNEEHLRFDFSHFSKASGDELAAVEALVNKKIREDIPVVIKEMPKEKALKMGAMALFGEKYGDEVRVVIIDPTYSVELCGGTHVGSTGELGIFKITHETAVASGVRRIEAVSGIKAEQYISAKLEQLDRVSQELKNPKDVVKSVEQLRNENTDLKQSLERLENRVLDGIGKELLQQKENIGETNFIGGIVDVPRADALKKLCADLKNKLTNQVIILSANIDGKPYAALCIDEKLVKEKDLDAGKIIKQQVAPVIKGGGGGQKTLATAGGQDPGNLQKVIDTVRNLLG